MDTIAFTTVVSVNTKTPFAGRSVNTRRPSSSVQSLTYGSSNVQMTAADLFQWRSQTKEAKEAATSTGVYTVQCTEGTSKSSDAESSRLAALAMNFRMRQTSTFEKCRDLYATRRAAIVQSMNSHTMETYAVRFPARAAASVQGRAEKLRACSRYFPTAPVESAEHLMFECVDRQYKAAKASTGVYSTTCADGRVAGDAETARVAALATNYRAGQLSMLQKTQMRYDAIREANMLGFGCDYEESYFKRFPKTAAAMRYSTGAYAAGVAEAAIITGFKQPSVDENINGINKMSYWPSFVMRAAVEKPSGEGEWWKQNSTLKNYAPMSSAAVSWGTAGQKSSAEWDKVKNYDTWSPGWQPSSALAIGPGQ